MAQRGIKVHDFVDVDSGDVYDQTQTDDAIKDGDVLDLGNGNVAILVEAWPTVFSGKIEHFHRLDTGFSFETLDDGKYAASAAKARELLQAQHLQLFADEAGNLVQVLGTSTPETVEYSAQGGGFLHTAPRAEFERRFKPATLPALSLIAISAEWLPDDMSVPAYSNGRRWNGWAMPCFTLEAGRSLLEHMPDLRYDSARDAFISKASDDGDEREDDVYLAETHVIDGLPIKLYAIGAGSWCWDLSERPDAVEQPRVAPGG